MPASQTLDIDGGVHCADFVGRDQNISYGFSAEDVERLISRVLQFVQDGAVFTPVAGQGESFTAEVDGQRLTFQPGAAQRLGGMGNLRAYLLSLLVDREYLRWAARFVPLAGKMDVRQELDGILVAFTELVIPTGEGGGQPSQKPLENIAEAMQTHGAFVILGEPGAGKTTTQQRIAYDAARGLLDNHAGRIPLFVRLSQQGQNDPYAFLQTEWERRTGTAFGDALRAGQMLILADGINEIPQANRRERLIAWMRFEQQYRGANQLIFSGREKDYDNQLSLPCVLVQPLDNPRIDEFLKRHNAEGLRELLDAPPHRLREMAANPLHLFVLTSVYLNGGRNLQNLANSGRLFETFTNALLENEQRWHSIDDLPVEKKVELFARLAYEMQRRGTGTIFALADAKNALPSIVDVLGEDLPLDPAALFRFGRGASIFDPATLPDVRFYHHLVQEYFAARELLRRFSSGEDLSAFWKAPRTVDEMPPTDVGEWDPLPEPPVTGWEVTTILACGLSRTPEKLIEAVRQTNPALAARCLDEAGNGKPESVTQAVQQNLLADLYDPNMHLRARLQAGTLLGKIGDPRFQAQEVNGVKVVLPQMVNVPGGKYIIGSNPGEPDSYDDEYPQHEVEIALFAIGKWPVTNAEYTCFMAAGGYQNEDYWQTDLAKRWLKGEEVGGGQLKGWLDAWKTMQSWPDVRERLEQSGNYSPEQVETFVYVAGLSEEELKEQLGKQLSQKSRSQPAYWDDPQYNNPSQPVVAITWFEANAYCAWLSAVTGQPYRLPCEPEWEAAARGLLTNHQLPTRVEPSRNIVNYTYPWGADFDPAKANTIEGRVLKPSLVGAYAAGGGVGPFGTEDQSGNVYNWISGLFQHYPYKPEIHENPESEEYRAVRGGSWHFIRRSARCAFRFGYGPVLFYGGFGFRLVSPAQS